MKILVVLILPLIALGCAEQSEQKYKDRAALEGKAGAEGETAETNKRAQQMERDLARIQNLFEGVSGTFSGEMRTPSGTLYRVRFAIASAIPRYEGSRTRTLDEITYDINNVAFDVLENTISPLPSGQELSFGCQYSNSRPAVDAGSFRLSTSGCPRSFVLTLIPSGIGIQDAEALQASGRMVASSILETRGTKAMSMQVEMRSVNLPEPVHFIVHRVR